MKTLDISLEVVRELLEYIPETGTLLQKKARPKVKVGAIAGVVTPYGYRYVQINGRKYAAHRLVWMLETGVMPAGELDHIDGNKLNNRITNLRIVTRKQNCENKGAQKNNQLGLRGVSFNTRLKKYVAQIQHNGVNLHLGVFVDPQDARAAYIEAQKKLFTHAKQAE